MRERSESQGPVQVSYHAQNRVPPAAIVAGLPANQQHMLLRCCTINTGDQPRDFKMRLCDAAVK